MFTKTTISAIRALAFLGLEGANQPRPPRYIAERLGESPTYLAKVMRRLVRAGILRAHRGVAGGLTLNRAPEEVSLLEIVEASQGAILGDFCQDAEKLEATCALHHAGAELHAAIVGVLSRWTLADVIERPCPGKAYRGQVECLLEPLGELAPRLRAGDRVPKRRRRPRAGVRAKRSSGRA